MNAYLRLARMHALAGTGLLLIPTICGLVLCSNSLYDLIWLPFVMFGAAVMRSAGCVINDIVDSDVDRQVERTKNRPIASGEISVKNAIIFLVVLLTVAASLLVFLDPTTIKICCVALILVFVYPFTKRFIYSQFYLGFVFNLGVIISCSIVNKGSISSSCFAFYIGCAFWTVYYDTIYAKQDAEYDKKLGLVSTALSAFGSREWLRRFYIICVVLWLISGLLEGLNFIYYASVLFCFFIFYKSLDKVFVDKDYWSVFSNSPKLGCVLFVGILLGKYLF